MHEEFVYPAPKVKWYPAAREKGVARTNPSGFVFPEPYEDTPSPAKAKADRILGSPSRASNRESLGRTVDKDAAASPTRVASPSRASFARERRHDQAYMQSEYGRQSSDVPSTSFYTKAAEEHFMFARRARSCGTAGRTETNVEAAGATRGQQKQLLIVNVDTALDLQPTDAYGPHKFCATAYYPGDPMAEIEERKTLAIQGNKSSTNPAAEDCVLHQRIAVPYNSMQQFLMVEIYEIDEIGESNFMGRVTVPLADPKLASTSPWALIRGSESNGTLTLNLQLPDDNASAGSDSPAPAPHRNSTPRSLTPTGGPRESFIDPGGVQNHSFLDPGCFVDPAACKQDGHARLSLPHTRSTTGTGCTDSSYTDGGQPQQAAGSCPSNDMGDNIAGMLLRDRVEQHLAAAERYAAAQQSPGPSSSPPHNPEDSFQGRGGTRPGSYVPPVEYGSVSSYVPPQDYGHQASGGGGTRQNSFVPPPELGASVSLQPWLDTSTFGGCCGMQTRSYIPPPLVPCGGGPEMGRSSSSYTPPATFGSPRPDGAPAQCSAPGAGPVLLPPPRMPSGFNAMPSVLPPAQGGQRPPRPPQQLQVPLSCTPQHLNLAAAPYNVATSGGRQGAYVPVMQQQPQQQQQQGLVQPYQQASRTNSVLTSNVGTMSSGASWQRSGCQLPQQPQMRPVPAAAPGPHLRHRPRWY